MLIEIGSVLALMTLNCPQKERGKIRMKQVPEKELIPDELLENIVHISV